jgi:hypothetical protein
MHHTAASIFPKDVVQLLATRQKPGADRTGVEIRETDRTVEKADTGQHCRHQKALVHRRVASSFLKEVENGDAKGLHWTVAKLADGTTKKY